jgi:hypothetical protein
VSSSSSSIFWTFLFLLISSFCALHSQCGEVLTFSRTYTSHCKQVSSASTPSPFELLRNRSVYVSCGKSLCGRGGLKLYADSDEMHLVTKSLESNSRRILFRFFYFFQVCQSSLTLQRCWKSFRYILKIEQLLPSQAV